MEDYEIIEELGSGIQGKTYLAKYLPLYKTCCLKEIECKDSDQANKIFEEMLRVRMSIENDDPAIALPFCMFIHWDASITSFFFYQAYDHFTSGNLKALMDKRVYTKEPISEKMIRKWIGEMIHIFQFLKSKNIIHRCVRPSNFFFRLNTTVMVSDICCSFVKEDINTRTRVSTGCMTFSAPEMVVGGERDSFNTDFWSMGMVVLGLLTCFQINYTDFCAHLIEYNFSPKALDSLFSSLCNVYSPELISTIKEILNKDKDRRINLDNLNDYLKGILDEIDKDKQKILDGVLEPLDLTQPQEYYINYLNNNYKSRICFRELLRFFGENISEEWSLFSLDDNVCSILLMSILHHIDTPDICSAGMKILGTQSVGLKVISEFYEVDKLMGVCNLAKKYPLCPDIQHATAKIFYACRNNTEARTCLNELNGIRIVMEIMRNFSTHPDIMTTVMKALWPMLLHAPNVQKVNDFKGCELVVRIISDNFSNINFFSVACLVVYGISLYDPNVVQLNEANCIPALLLGLSLHKRDPTVVTNACNALCSMTDAEEESAYILATTKCDSDDTSGIELLGELCALHLDSQDVVEVILKVFTSLCRHDDIVSDMRCSVVGEAINDLAYAYIDIYEVSHVCSELQKKIKELQPLTYQTIP